MEQVVRNCQRVEVMHLGKPTASSPRTSPFAPAFTLIETIVVVMLLSIMAGMIVVRMNRSVDARAVLESAERFAHLARTVRELAVSRQSPAAMEVDLDQGRYHVTVTGSSGESRAVQMTWLKPVEVRLPVRIDAFRSAGGQEVSRGRQQLSFRADGTSGGGMVRFALEENAVQVVVQPHSGQVFVHHEGDPPPPPDQKDLGD